MGIFKKIISFSVKSFSFYLDAINTSNSIEFYEKTNQIIILVKSFSGSSSRFNEAKDGVLSSKMFETQKVDIMDAIYQDPVLKETNDYELEASRINKSPLTRNAQFSLFFKLYSVIDPGIIVEDISFGEYNGRFKDLVYIKKKTDSKVKGNKTFKKIIKDLFRNQNK